MDEENVRERRSRPLYLLRGRNEWNLGESYDDNFDTFQHRWNRVTACVILSTARTATPIVLEQAYAYVEYPRIFAVRTLCFKLMLSVHSYCYSCSCDSSTILNRPRYPAHINLITWDSRSKVRMV